MLLRITNELGRQTVRKNLIIKINQQAYINLLFGIEPPGILCLKKNMRDNQNPYADHT